MVSWWKNLSAKHQLRFAGVGLVLLGLLVYHLAISRSIALSSEVALLRDELSLTDQADERIRGLKDQLVDLSGQVGSSPRPPIESQELIVGEASRFCESHKLDLRRVTDFQTEELAGFQLASFHITARGDFLSLVELLDHLENKKRLGRVTSARFELVKDRRTRAIHLEMELLLQTLAKLKQ